MEDVHDFEVHGPQNFYTIEAADCADAETIKALVDQSIRKYDRDKAEFTIDVTPAKD